MQFQSLRYNLNQLITSGHKWQYTDINNYERKPRLYFTKIQYLAIFSSVIGVICLPKGFDKDFIGYTIASLSIFVGLFLSLILLVFDKFVALISENKERTRNLEIKLIQHKNFSKQFTSLTAYSIIISILCIFLLSLSLLYNIFNLDFQKIKFIESISDINYSSIKLFVLCSLLSTYRIVVFYFLIDFFIITLYAISSIFNFIMVKYDEIKIDKI